MQKLLRKVSRSFYLTLHILPYSIRPQISLAYLLARATDTVADTRLFNVQRRREVLCGILQGILSACEGQPPPPVDLGDVAEARKATAGYGTLGERILLEKIGTILDALRKFTVEDRERIREVLTKITHGQELDLIRFGAASADRIVALGTDAELEEYIYCVAGCVGEFWTKICNAHLFSKALQDCGIFRSNGIRFGKGLQLVNILRDLPTDLRQGRCYIPKDRLSSHGLQPRDLLEVAAMGRFRPLFSIYLQQAEDHLSAGWSYTMAVPFRHMRIRLACAWPILIGMKTLDQLRRINVLDNRYRIKLSRWDVRCLMLKSVLLYPCPKAWNRLLRRTEKLQ